MTEQEWITLKDGEKVYNEIDGTLEVMWYDFYYEGKPIMCLCSEKSIWPAWQFYPEDWEKVS